MEDGCVDRDGWLGEAMLGLPVLVHGASWLSTAGYLFSFPVIAAFVGWCVERGWSRKVLYSLSR